MTTAPASEPELTPLALRDVARRRSTCTHRGHRRCPSPGWTPSGSGTATGPAPGHHLIRTDTPMSKRRCAGPSCPRLVDQGAPRGRCESCRSKQAKERGTRQERGYGAHHTTLRADYQRRMDAGERFTCWRCPAEIDPQAWHLGHCDSDRTWTHGPECVPCNTATSTHLSACPHPSHTPGG